MPYTPIIEQSDTRKSPRLGGLVRLKHALFPYILVALLSPDPAKARPRSLWDRAVFVWFFGCLLVLSYTLAGFGYSGHDHATCTLFTNMPSYTSASAIIDTTALSPSLLKVVGSDAEVKRLGWERDGGLTKDHRSVLGRSRGSDDTAEPLVFKSAPTTSPFEHANENPRNPHDPQVSIANLPTLPRLVGHDPFDLEPYFDGGGYGNDGQPFALKVHIPQDDSSTRTVYHSENSRRCRGTGWC